MLLREKCARAGENREQAWARLALQHRKLIAENDFYKSCIRIFDIPSAQQIQLHGPLAASSFAVKDNMAVAGSPVSFGISPSVVPCASSSATLVTQIQECGACAFAATNLDELCLSHNGNNSSFGRVVNPVDSELAVLGSSCGSAAAVARGQVDFALGSDFGGSIRLPAASCGLCGFKSGSNFLSRAGVLLLSETLDACGVITKYADDLVYILSALGHSVPQSFSLSDTTLYFPTKKDLSAADDESRERFEEFIAQARLLTHVVEFPADLSFEDILETRKIIAIEHSVKALKHLGVDDAHLPPAAKALLIYYKDLSTARRAAALCHAQEITSTIDNVIKGQSFLVTPTLPCRSPTWKTLHDNAPLPAPLNHFLALANLCELPALSFQTGLKLGKLPFPVQVMGRPGCDVELAVMCSKLQEHLLLGDKTIK